MDLKAEVLKRYPDLKIGNEYFLDEKHLAIKPNALTIYDIARLSELSNEDGFVAYHNIINHGLSYGSYNEMVKYIALNNPSFLQTIFKGLNSEKLVYEEYERLYKGQDFSLEDFALVHERNQVNKDKDIASANTDIFNEIVIAQELYRRGKLSNAEIEAFKGFYFDYIKNKVNDNYALRPDDRDIDFNKYVMQCSEALLEGKINIFHFYGALNGSQTLLNLLSVSKVGISISSNDIPIDIMASIKGKSIKNIIKQVDSYEGKTSILQIRAIIKMIAYLGVDNATLVVRHLENKQERDYVFNCFDKINLSGVKTKDGKIVYNEDFIRLFMGSHINEPTSLFNKIKGFKTDLGGNLQSIYTFWDELDRRYQKQNLETRLAFLENAFKQSEVFLDPDEYVLEGEIINSYYDNTQFQYLPKDELVKEIRSLYKQMRHRFEKTIPYVSGSINGVFYETLKANDPTLLEMGNATFNCFKIGADADSFVRYCALNKNARVICFRNELGDIIGMSPIIRNGNMIICNSVEKGRGFTSECFVALQKASEQIINISRHYEDENDMIRGVLIGNYKNQFDKINVFEKTHTKVNTRPLDDTVYANMGIDYSTYKVSGIYESEDELMEFEPTTVYLDPREDIKDAEEMTDEVRQRINAICFERYGSILPEETFRQIEYVSYNDDWFTLITKNGNTIGAYVSLDPRASLEYEGALEAYNEFGSFTR